MSGPELEMKQIPADEDDEKHMLADLRENCEEGDLVMRIDPAPCCTHPMCQFMNMNRVLESSRMNWLLLAMPFGIVSSAAGWSDGVSFVFALLALIPQAQLLGMVTEQLALYTNEAIGGLLNATFGNVPELIISIIALRKGMLRIVQVSLLGSILSNCLLVLGSAFLLGGIHHKTQKYNTQMQTTNSGLLMVAVMGLVLPASLDAADAERSATAVLGMSRFASLMLLGIYGALIYFQLKTHRHLVEEDDDEDEEEEKVLTFWQTIFWLAVDSIFIALFSEILVSSIEGAAASWNCPKIFIGVIVIPIVGNAAEHASAVLVAMRDKIELSLAIAIGSAIQIALFGIPLMVVAAWMIGQPLSLDFHVFETAATLTAAIAVGFVVSDGTGNYLKGVLLIVAYLIVAAGFFAHTDNEKK